MRNILILTFNYCISYNFYEITFIIYLKTIISLYKLFAQSLNKKCGYLPIHQKMKMIIYIQGRFEIFIKAKISFNQL